MDEPFDACLEIIKSTSQENQNEIIYISIGCAAHREFNEKWILEDEKNQQYPCFLKNIPDTITTGRKHILLIDPIIEYPPHITQELSVKEPLINNSWIEDKICNDFIIFTNTEKNIIVYSIKRFAIYNPSVRNEEYNITSFCDKINQLSIEKNILSIIHDFSGNNICRLGEFFEEKIKDHLDHIIYGIGIRRDDGCFPTLTEQEYLFAYYKDKSIKIFNPYCFEDDIDKAYNFIENHGIDERLGRLHVAQMIKNKKEYIANVLMVIFRQSWMLCKGEKPIINKEWENVNIILKYKINLFDLYKNGQYDTILCIVMDILRKEMYNICKNNDKIDVIFDKILCEQDIYKWNNIMNIYLNN